MSDLFPVDGWTDKGDGLLPLLRAQGVFVAGVDGIAMSNNPTLAKQILDAYDPLPDAKAKKLSELADFRWSKEVGGITISGMIIETTDRSKTLVTGALMLAQSNPAATFQFKTTDNQYVEVDAAGMVAIYQAIGAHVQACFAREQQIAAVINALDTVEAVASYDIAAEW